MNDDPTTAPSPRRRATRMRLFEAATEVFAESGLQGASVEAICSRAGFTRGAFYSNFASKEELFLAMLRDEFDQRAREVESMALGIEPELLACGGRLTPPEAARYIAEFFMPRSDATAWFALETEFLLLAMRDPALAPGHHDFLEGFYAGISGIVERVILAAGRRFTLPVEHAIPVLADVYHRALRASALAGPAAPGGIDELSDRLAELLFALTEVIAEPVAAQSGAASKGAESRNPESSADPSRPRTPPSDRRDSS
ncbi:TetR/AcrR family transcriptional regulator [Leucobacter soli]|uniref:HTH tetR-type domain-containing protein n=1 Tax=Leucobacter soli TaxID=2812850 RepID=A0A916JV21_9MICO|nr:TetR/AcrR family transcriptional regulator [Leucobacter soli]CAG7606229.1 hypothetical protein LEUCIP111803_00902 [Leucobacter soli]